ncbi:(R)-mandelonitrile lyase [Terrirubrum flagellatum]|uniref:(R)-mandelonitrile lyase n=1 Tax=Terrirubrum flagellatum TaxID=2895980 RepID=UPI003CC82BF0
MRRPMTIALSAALLAPALVEAQTLKVSPNGARSSSIGSAANFTGAVAVTPLFAPNEYNNAGAGQVEFAPGARSHWHTHPAGQTLIITSGTGWVQQEGGEKIQVRAGDVIWAPPGVKHWHGATAGNSMSHIAVTPTLDGKNVDWLEPVTDEQFR